MKENNRNLMHLMQGHGCDGKVSEAVCGFNRKDSHARLLMSVRSVSRGSGGMCLFIFSSFPYFVDKDTEMLKD